MADTNIPVSNAVWRYLNRQKNQGDTFDDVLRREFDIEEVEA